MIRHDDGHTQLSGQGRFANGGNTVVHGNEDLHSRASQVPDSRFVESVTLIMAGRDVAIDEGALLFEAAIQDGGGADAVRVVIAVNTDPLSVPDSLSDASDSFGHALHLPPIGQRLFLGMQECFDLLRGIYPAAQQGADCDRGKAESVRKLPHHQGII